MSLKQEYIMRDMCCISMKKENECQSEGVSQCHVGKLNQLVQRASAWIGSFRFSSKRIRLHVHFLQRVTPD